LNRVKVKSGVGRNGLLFGGEGPSFSANEKDPRSCDRYLSPVRSASVGDNDHCESPSVFLFIDWHPSGKVIVARNTIRAAQMFFENTTKKKAPTRAQPSL
jgi:hypothetical protein